MNLKLDEIIRCSQYGLNELIDIEKLSDSGLEKLEKRHEKIRQGHDARKRRRHIDKRKP
jgi:low affinity Fe/Cu permease